MYEYKAKVIRCIDGDTFEVNVDVGFSITITTKLRLADIDTPESYRPRNEAERTHGNAAKVLVEALMLNQWVTIRTNKTGKYGRYIAHVELPDGRDLTEVLKEHDMTKRTEY